MMTHSISTIKLVAQLSLFFYAMMSPQAYADIIRLDGLWVLEANSVDFSIPEEGYGTPRQHQVVLMITLQPETHPDVWRISLQGQCNNYGARLEILQSGALSFSNLVKTNQHCPDWRDAFDRLLTRRLFSSTYANQASRELFFFSGEGMLQFNKMSE
jgi:hypothetical protein